MARYRVTLYKQIPDRPTIRPWTNVYYLETSSLENALLGGHAIAQQEKLILKEYVTITKVHAVQDNDLHQAGASEPDGTVGTVVGDLNLMLPLFNAVRIVFSDGVGRPSQKYFRCPLQEDEQEGGALIGAFIDDINTNYCENLIGIPGLVSNSGDPFTSIACQPNVQMRQVNWHRRHRPGFKRGWVPE